MISCFFKAWDFCDEKGGDAFSDAPHYPATKEQGKFRSTAVTHHKSGTRDRADSHRIELDPSRQCLQYYSLWRSQRFIGKRHKCGHDVTLGWSIHACRAPVRGATKFMMFMQSVCVCVWVGFDWSAERLGGIEGRDL